MSHRAKHRRSNWVPERLKKTTERQAKDDARKAEDAIRRQKQTAK